MHVGKPPTSLLHISHHRPNVISLIRDSLDLPSPSSCTQLQEHPELLLLQFIHLSKACFEAVWRRHLVKVFELPIPDTNPGVTESQGETAQNSS